MSGLGSRASAACKPQGNQPFTIFKKSAGSLNMTKIWQFLFQKFQRTKNGFMFEAYVRLPCPGERHYKHGRVLLMQ